ncbi:MAG TPA: magnesium-translocating P-type ATPase [Anaerolineaceae bacterium]|nr:magnesium-translocating P-type ATPase [Anaerolineaceae bacterium]
MGFLSTILTRPLHGIEPNRTNTVHVSNKLLDSAHLESTILLNQLNTSLAGLSQEEYEARLEQFGPNVVAREKRQSPMLRLLDNIKNPLVILLSALGLISYFTADVSGAIVIAIIVLLGLVLRFFQEQRADNAAEKLKAMVNTTASVLRNGNRQEVPLHELVPGDIVQLSAGDMIPADVRILNAKDLFINQAALTGESLPVEKISTFHDLKVSNALEITNIGFLGSNVESGTANAVVVLTGSETYFGSLANSITGQRQLTSFDKGVNKFTWLMISFMLVMVPAVFVINGISKGNWLEAFLFALAVAVGLTPEMLPMIVTVNLSKGAIAMSHKKVIVKRLNSIQNFGAMDVLCTDKTGTITEGRIVLEKHLDVSGHENDEILYQAYLNSYYQTGLKNLMDVAVLEHVQLERRAMVDDRYHKIDEIPFDFHRRRMSVVVEDDEGNRVLITKGAVEELFNISTRVEVRGEVLARLPEYDLKRKALVDQLNAQGFRVIAVAYKPLPGHGEVAYSVLDESDMILKGFLAFLDPPKDSAPEALSKLNQYNVQVKILTGDNDLVTTTICQQVGLCVENILLGSDIEAMSEAELAQAAEKTSVFAKLSPAHKERIIRALQKAGHVVGFMGDGINDAPALKAADVGISVNTAVDIAKESSDIILLENSLLVLEQGVVEGRKVFGNIIKYIKMAASSNFGNMFSVVGASAFLPFLPMLPLQVLTNNLLYDFSQTSIPTDDVDPEWLAKPRKWTIGELRRFIVFIGPISSIFDYCTFFLMLYVFNCWANPTLFQTGWFVESLFTQTLIIHVIRTNKIPFIQSRASWPLLLTSLLIVSIGAYLPFSPLASLLGFTALPPSYWLYLLAMLLSYIALTQVVKTWFVRRFGD